MENNIDKNIYRKEKDGIYLGNEKIRPEYLDVIKTQASTLKKSELWEILRATLINQASESALKSVTWENVQFAKALRYYVTVIDKVLKELSEYKLDK
jgi:hypothetical protein